MNKKYKAAVIGCGSIGALKDNKYDSPEMPHNILTHAHAYYDCPDTELVAVIDMDIEKAKKAGDKWGCSTDTDILNFRNENIDIISVCTPTETHFDILKQVLELKPKLVVAEKPFCSNLKEAEEISAIYKQAGIPMLINYTRRFEPDHIKVFNNLRTGEYGMIYHARCLYGRGLKRDGCHGLDIFNYTLGQLHNVLWHNSITNLEPNDPSYSLQLDYEKCAETYMIAVDSRHYGLFELEFVTEKGIISFLNWGQKIFFFKPDNEKTYGQYKSLNRDNAFVNVTSMGRALSYMVESAVRYLRNNEPLICTPDDAIKVHKIIEGRG